MGASPQVVDWNNDGKKDLVTGEGDGHIRIYLNTGDDASPSFSGYTYLQTAASDFDSNGISKPDICDWNDDGKKDVLCGGGDGKIYLLINTGTDSSPAFTESVFIQDGDADLNVGGRASPVVVDWNRDGKKDLIVGSASGKLSYFENKGTDDNPLFDGSELLQIGGSVIDLGYYSRPDVVDWDNDGIKDIICGSYESATTAHVWYFRGTDSLVQLSPTEGRKTIVMPTVTTTFQMTVKNIGGQRETIGLETTSSPGQPGGLPPLASSVSPSSITLGPGESNDDIGQDVTVTVSGDASTLPGEYRARLQATPRSHPSLVNYADIITKIEWGPVLINEVVTDPQQDWNDTADGNAVPFDDEPGTGAIDDGDEWIELLNKTDVTIDLTEGSGWQLHLTDSSGVDVLNLAQIGGRTVLAFSSGGAVDNWRPGEYLVVGGTADSGLSLDDDVFLQLFDSNGNLLDDVEIGDDPEADGAGDGAPSLGVNGDADGVSDESVARYPDGADTENDVADFIKMFAAIGAPNAPPDMTLVMEAGANNPQPDLVIGDATDVAMLQVKITNRDTLEPCTVTSITFTASGTGDDLDDVARVRLFRDVDGDGLLTDGTDAQIADDRTYSKDDGVVVFDGLNEIIVKAGVVNWLLVYDFAGTADSGETFRASLMDNGNVSAEGAISTEAFDAIGAPITGSEIVAGREMIAFEVIKAKIQPNKKHGGYRAKISGRFQMESGNDISKGVVVAMGAAGFEETVFPIQKRTSWIYKRPKGDPGGIKKLMIKWDRNERTKTATRLLIVTDTANLFDAPPNGPMNVAVSLRLGREYGAEMVWMTEKKGKLSYKAPK